MRKTCINRRMELLMRYGQTNKHINIVTLYSAFQIPSFMVAVLWKHKLPVQLESWNVNTLQQTDSGNLLGHFTWYRLGTFVPNGNNWSSRKANRPSDNILGKLF